MPSEVVNYYDHIKRDESCSAKHEDVTFLWAPEPAGNQPTAKQEVKECFIDQMLQCNKAILPLSEGAHY